MADTTAVEGDGPGLDDWSSADRTVTSARAHGLQVLAMIGYTPAWARPTGSGDKTPPTDPTSIKPFAQAAAARYAPLGVHAWEIWNEPNIATYRAPRPNVGAYARLLGTAASGIHVVDPGRPW